MTRAKPTYTPEPRIWNSFQVATRLGMSESAFGAKQAELEGLGFPHRDDFFDSWDADAVERWLDLRSGLHLATGGDGGGEWEVKADG